MSRITVVLVFHFLYYTFIKCIRRCQCDLSSVVSGFRVVLSGFFPFVRSLSSAAVRFAKHYNITRFNLQLADVRWGENVFVKKNNINKPV